MKLRPTIIVFFFTIGHFSYAQSEYDSLINLLLVAKKDTNKVNILNQASVRATNQDTAYILAHQAITLSSNLSWTRGLGAAHINLAFIYHRIGMFDSASYHYKQCIPYFEKINEVRGLAFAENNMGLISQGKGEYGKALFYFQSSLKKKFELNAFASIAGTYNNMGIIKMEQKNYIEAIDLFNKSINLKDSIGDTKTIPSSIGNIGLVHSKMGKYTEAISYFKDAYQMAIEEDVDGENLFNADGLADAYNLNNELDSAEKYADEALERAIESNVQYVLASTYQTLGSIDQKRGNIDKAEDYFIKGLQIAKENELLVFIESSSSALYKFYKEQNNLQKALEYLELNKATNDSLFNADMTEQLTTMELDFSFQQEKDSINFRFEREKIDLNADLKRKTLIQNFTTIGLLIAVIFIIIVYRFYRLKNRSNQQLSEKNDIISNALKEKDHLIKEIHHRVKNNLQIVSSLLNIQSKFVNDKEAEKAIQDMQNRVVSMSLVHQNLYTSQSVTHIFTDEYIKSLADSVNKTFNDLDEPVMFETNIERVKISSNQAVKLGLAINEILTNSFKHAFPDSFEGNPHIKVSVDKKDDSVKLAVEDNGVGFEKGKREESYGLRLLKSLTKSMNGILTIDESERTSIILEVPTSYEL